MGIAAVAGAQNLAVEGDITSGGAICNATSCLGGLNTMQSQFQRSQAQVTLNANTQTYLRETITPMSAQSLIRVRAVFYGHIIAGYYGTRIHVRLSRDGVPMATRQIGSNDAQLGSGHNGTLTFLDQQPAGMTTPSEYTLEVWKTGTLGGNTAYAAQAEILVEELL